MALPENFWDEPPCLDPKKGRVGWLHHEMHDGSDHARKRRKPRRFDDLTTTLLFVYEHEGWNIFHSGDGERVVVKGVQLATTKMVYEYDQDNNTVKKVGVFPSWELSRATPRMEGWEQATEWILAVVTSYPGSVLDDMSYSILSDMP